MEKKLNLTVKTPEGAKIRVFGVTFAGVKDKETETEVFPAFAGDGETGFELEKGRYVVRQEKAGYYSAEQCMDVEQDMTLSLPLEKRSLHGYEPHEDRMVYTYRQWDQFAPDDDERWKPYEVIFTTPSFLKKDGEGAHRIPTNEELWEFVRSEERANANMKVYTLFESGVYNLPAPIAVFSKDLPEEEMTLEELGAYLQKTGKPVVHYQAQIHGNETSGGEAAMGMMKYLATPEGSKLLDTIHLYVIPRLNPEGALLFQRANGQGLDLNRDFFIQYSREIEGACRAFRAFQPCLVIDAHELRSRKLQREFRYEDILLSSGCEPNTDPELFENNLELLFRATDELQKVGLRNYFYLDHISGAEMATATRYFMESGAMTVLIECRGIDLGLGRYRRRIMGQFTAARRILEEVAANPEKYAEPCRRDRASYLAPFDREFVVEGAYTDDPENDPKFPIVYHDLETGEVIRTEEKPVTIYRKAVRTRPRPQAYVIPLGKPWERELTDLMDRLRIKYERSSVAHTFVMTRFVKEGDQVVLTAPAAQGLEGDVLFIPVAQEASRYVSFLFEVDCPDSLKAKQTTHFARYLQDFFFPEGDAYDVYRVEQ